MTVGIISRVAVAVGSGVRVGVDCRTEYTTDSSRLSFSRIIIDPTDATKEISREIVISLFMMVKYTSLPTQARRKQ